MCERVGRILKGWKRISFVITGLVPVILIGRAQRLTLSGWPAQGLP
jgi:hypothetical protein